MENSFRPYSIDELKAKRESNHFQTKIENEIRSSFNTNLYLKYLYENRQQGQERNVRR